MTVVRVGIIGSGFMGQTHAEAIDKYLNEAELVAVAGGKRAPELARDYGIAAEKNIASLLARDDIDAVVITTPQAVHAAQAIEAAEQRKHILLEKPMAVTVEECQKINAACKRAGVKLMMAFTQRYRKCNIFAKQAIDRGDIGEIKFMRETMIGVNGPQIYPPWQQRAENLGTLLGYGVHSIDRVRWFTGKEIQWVAAHTLAPPQIEAEYSAHIFMGLDDKTSASLLCEMNCPSPGFSHSGFHSWIIGTEGIIDLDAYGEVRLGRDNKWETLFVQEPIDWIKDGKFSPVRMQSFADQDQEFIRAILEDRQPDITGKDGQKAVEVALAAYRAANNSITVHLK